MAGAAILAARWAILQYGQLKHDIVDAVLTIYSAIARIQTRHRLVVALVVLLEEAMEVAIAEVLLATTAQRCATSAAAQITLPAIAKHKR